MDSYEILAAEAALKSAMLGLLVAHLNDGKYMSAIRAQLEIFDGDADGHYEIGGVSSETFKPFKGASL